MVWKLKLPTAADLDEQCILTYNFNEWNKEGDNFCSIPMQCFYQSVFHLSGYEMTPSVNHDKIKTFLHIVLFFLLEV